MKRKVTRQKGIVFADKRFDKIEATNSKTGKKPFF